VGGGAAISLLCLSELMEDILPMRQMPSINRSTRQHPEGGDPPHLATSRKSGSAAHFMINKLTRCARREKMPPCEIMI
jgi:hypothetical protein